MSEQTRDSPHLGPVLLSGEVLRRLNMIATLIDTIGEIPITSERKRFLLACFDQVETELNYLRHALGG